MVIDGMLKDGLWDVYNDYAMGMCGELCADQHMITREEQVPAYKLQLYLVSIFFLQETSSKYISSTFFQ